MGIIMLQTCWCMEHAILSFGAAGHIGPISMVSETLGFVKGFGERKGARP